MSRSVGPNVARVRKRAASARDNVRGGAPPATALELELEYPPLSELQPMAIDSEARATNHHLKIAKGATTLTTLPRFKFPPAETKSSRNERALLMPKSTQTWPPTGPVLDHSFPWKVSNVLPTHSDLSNKPLNEKSHRSSPLGEPANKLPPAYATTEYFH